MVKIKISPGLKKWKEAKWDSQKVAKRSLGTLYKVEKSNPKFIEQVPNQTPPQSKYPLSYLGARPEKYFIIIIALWSPLPESQLALAFLGHNLYLSLVEEECRREGICIRNIFELLASISPSCSFFLLFDFLRFRLAGSVDWPKIWLWTLSLIANKFMGFAANFSGSSFFLLHSFFSRPAIV